MKNIIDHLNKAFDNRTRLGIMSVLLVTDWADFKALRESLGVSDGNLASHLKTLEKETYIEVRKTFIGKKPNTAYKVTPLGKKAFNDHLNALEELLKNRG
ncbi:MAG: transcriptional regulator [Saprospiraceae bacterium]|nr:transcriptional regulator [Saprospiraceae bacterium]